MTIIGLFLLPCFSSSGFYKFRGLWLILAQHLLTSLLYLQIDLSYLNCKEELVSEQEMI